MVPGAATPEPHRLRYAWNLAQGSRVIAKLGNRSSDCDYIWSDREAALARSMKALSRTPSRFDRIAALSAIRRNRFRGHYEEDGALFALKGDTLSQSDHRRRQAAFHGCA